MSKSPIKLALALIAGATVSSVILAPSTMAGQLSNERTFDHPPSLVRGTTSNPATQFPSTYEFTLTVPANAGKPLEAVTIRQADIADKAIEFDLSQSVAYAGDRARAGTQLPLASIGGPESKGETTIVFEPPVQPGTTVTVVLEAKRNPSRRGTYWFGITAYPVGNQANGTFLGHRQLTLYDNLR